MKTSTFIYNKFGPDWLEILKKKIISIHELNIAADRILIDSNREYILIQGHRTKNSKAFLTQTIISSIKDRLNVKVRIWTPYLVMFVIAPIILIIYVWSNSNLSTSLMTTLIFILNLIYCFLDLRKQNKFNQILISKMSS